MSTSHFTAIPRASRVNHCSTFSDAGSARVVEVSPSDFGLVMIPLVLFFIVSAYISVRIDKFIKPKLIILFGSLCTLFSSSMILIICHVLLACVTLPVFPIL